MGSFSRSCSAPFSHVAALLRCWPVLSDAAIIITYCTQHRPSVHSQSLQSAGGLSHLLRI
jgi:hypothetical protein